MWCTGIDEAVGQKRSQSTKAPGSWDKERVATGYRNAVDLVDAIVEMEN